MNANGQKPNSHNHHEGAAAPEQPLHPLDNVFSPAPQGGPILEMRTGLWHLAYNRAVLSGASEPVPEDLKALQDHARAVARDTFREKFDPVNNPHDHAHQVEYERLLKQRDEIELGIAHAQANVHQAERALASIAKAGPQPEANPWLVAAFVVALLTSLSPTLHDVLFYTIPDPLLSWFWSSGCASFLATMLTLAILSGRRTAWRWAGGIAGVVLGIGLLALRLSSAQGPAEVLFAFGLTIVEISAVGLLEWLASGLRTSDEEWVERKFEEDKAIAARDAEIADLERRKTSSREVNEDIRQKIAYFEDRAFRNLHLPELEAVAVDTVRDGYSAGIAENVGRLRGVQPTRRMQ
jgi:hypothetical protein